MERVQDDEVVVQNIPSPEMEGELTQTTEHLNDRVVSHDGAVYADGTKPAGVAPDGTTLVIRETSAETLARLGETAITSVGALKLEEPRYEIHAPVKFMPLNMNAKMPTRGTRDSAGYDLYASEDIVVPSGETVLVPLGFATEIDYRFHGRIESRSGMAVKGMVVLTGVIDADYRGEWKVILHNLTGENFAIAVGDRVAQVVMRPTVGINFQSVSELSESSRAGGFGSTGTR